MLELKKVSLIYDINKESKTYALKNMNIKLDSDKFYGILGPSGSGKSSFLYTLSGLKKPTEGKVIYNNLILNDQTDGELARIRRNEFGFIFQKHYLINYLTVLQNVLVPVNSNSEEMISKAKELLNALGMLPYINKKPYQLSGGQAQRVAIARALINQPKVIFADEITASLDHNSAKDAMKVLNRFKGKATLVVVTHDPSILEDADEIIHIWDGEIREEMRD